eukprot:GHVR01029800.1.p1 GENE.GHVR01029800.1~~GHVR01029800.1.p1  ORF type:complete len:109 (-),score=10.80 GHVR01029800.1:321-647(-)
MENSNTIDFLLSQQLVGHSKGVRCVCVLSDDTIVTGGQEGLVILWRLHENTQTHNFYKKLEHHTNFVFSLTCSLVSGPITFYSGGFDQRIFRLTADGDPMTQFNCVFL